MIPAPFCLVSNSVQDLIGAKEEISDGDSCLFDAAQYSQVGAHQPIGVGDRKGCGAFSVGNGDDAAASFFASYQEGVVVPIVGTVLGIGFKTDLDIVLAQLFGIRETE